MHCSLFSSRLDFECHDFWNMMESSLAATSASSLSTPRPTWSSPMDVCMLGFLRSWTWSSPMIGLEKCGERLQMKTEAKRLLKTSFFSMLVVPGLLSYLSGKDNIFFSLLFLASVPAETLVITLHACEMYFSVFSLASDHVLSTCKKG